MKRELRGLIFDFDGTIAETERFGHRIAYNHAFVEQGLDWRWDENLYADLLSVAGGQERLRYYLQRYRPALLKDTLASGQIADIHRAKVRHFAKIAPTIPLRPGVFRLVNEAHTAGLAVAIATTGAQLGVQALLAHNKELPGMIDVIAGAEAAERKKPEPDVYVWALEKMGLNAENCVAVEDSNIGLRAALAAGLPTVITVSDYTAKDDFTGAAAVLSNLGERCAPARSLHGCKPSNGIVDLAFLRAILSSAT